MSRKRYLPRVDSSGDESVSEDSEYVPSDNEINLESDESSDKTEENSDTSEENNARRGSKRKVSKPLPKCEVQNTPKKTGRGRRPIAYKDYVS